MCVWSNGRYAVEPSISTRLNFTCTFKLPTKEKDMQYNSSQRTPSWPLTTLCYRHVRESHSPTRAHSREVSVFILRLVSLFFWQYVVVVVVVVVVQRKGSVRHPPSHFPPSLSFFGKQVCAVKKSTKDGLELVSILSHHFNDPVQMDLHTVPVQYNKMISESKGARLYDAGWFGAEFVLVAPTWGQRCGRGLDEGSCMWCFAGRH